MNSSDDNNGRFLRAPPDSREIYQDLALAGTVQQSLLPPLSISSNGIEVAGYSASCNAVGGDYFDCLHGPEFPGTALRIVIGDASGHGINAALLMRSARTFIRTRTMGRRHDPKDVVTAMNRFLADDVGGTGSFMTMLFLEIDVESRRMRWVRAGHDPAIVYEPRSGLFFKLIGKGPPLGVDGNYFYEEYQWTKLSGGTVIALATDGIWEARNEHQEPYGKERLRGIMQKYVNEPAQTIVNALFNSLRKFCRGVPIEDDLTLMVVKIT